MYIYRSKKNNETLKEYATSQITEIVKANKDEKNKILSYTLYANGYYLLLSNSNATWRLAMECLSKDKRFVTKALLYDTNIEEFTSWNFYDSTVPVDHIVNTITTTDSRFIDLGYAVKKEYLFSYDCSFYSTTTGAVARILINPEESLRADYDIFNKSSIIINDNSFKNFFKTGNRDIKNTACIVYHCRSGNKYNGPLLITINSFEKYIDALEKISKSKSPLREIAAKKAKEYRKFVEKILNGEITPDIWAQYYEFLSNEIIVNSAKKVSATKKINSAEKRVKKVEDAIENVSSVDKLLLEVLDF